MIALLYGRIYQVRQDDAQDGLQSEYEKQHVPSHRTKSALVPA